MSEAKPIVHPGWLNCPACGYRMDASAPVANTPADAQPSDGDSTICIACASIGIYAFGTAALRLPTVEERGELMAEPDVRAAVDRVVEARLNWGKGWPKGPGAQR